MQRECVLLPSVACPALQYCSTLSHKQYDFRKKKLLCVLVFSLNLKYFMQMIIEM